jgi:ATP-binding cassette subfamily B protein
MGQFAELYSQLQKAIGATQRVRELLRETGEVEALLGPTPPSTLPRLRGDVVFENVHFSYPSRQGVEVLHAINLAANSGQRIALVGPSGAGKSTLISRLLRLYDPSPGRVLIDGRDARDYRLTELRGQMSMVPQEALRFGGTIAENITYGKPGASAEEIAQAAQQANAHEFIESGETVAVRAQREIIQEFLAFGVSPGLKDGGNRGVIDCARSTWIRELLADR